jgi:hypothetical protein
MMYNTQKYWVSGLRPWSGILNTTTQRFGNWMFPSPGEGEGTHTLLGPLERTDRNHWIAELVV